MSAESIVVLFGALALQSLQTPSAKPVLLNRLPKVQTVVAAAPRKKGDASLGIDVGAQAAILMDAQTGEILFQKNADKALPIASLTKLVAAMTYLDTKPDFTRSIQFMKEDAGNATRIFKDAESVKIGDAFDALLVGSINESANAFARTTLGEQAFVDAMNRKAASLGMRDAKFTDAAGLGITNKATAKDVAIALRAAYNYPQIRQSMAKTSISIQGKVAAKPYLIKTTNMLLTTELNKKPYHIMAAKTGTLPEAGFCFAQMTEGPDGQKVIAVVLGDDTHFTRFQDVKALTYWAFQNYEWPKPQARN